MRIHSLQHVPFEDLGSMLKDFEARGYQVTTTHWYKGEQAPELDKVDGLIVLGGPMGVYDEEIYPWLAVEKLFIRNAIAAGKTVIGICLGAQLIADILGAPVTQNPFKEIGWFPLEIAPEAVADSVAQILTRQPEVFHWHGDTFAIPVGARCLARSAGCLHQAFSYENRVWGFQFHLETTLESASALVAHCGDEIDGSRFTQAAELILQDRQKFLRINQTMSEVITAIFGKLT